MRRDLTTGAANRQETNQVRTEMSERPWRGWRLDALLPALLAAAGAALLLVLVYQIPATHRVDIGGYDAAYTQGFFDPERLDSQGHRAYLEGSTGGARWTRDVSYLLFPQAGLPAEVTLRLRGWRASGAAPEVTVLLVPGPGEPQRELARFRPSAGWEEHTFPIQGGLLKPSDVAIEIRSEVAPLSDADPRIVGILLDEATYRVGPPPIAPYPAQLAYGGLAGALLWLLARPPAADDRPSSASSGGAGRLYGRRWVLGGLALLAVAFLLLYRLQPPYPYPLRGLLPAVCVALGSLVVLRYGPALAARLAAALDALALGGVALWLGATLVAAQRHVVLSTPGVENDFRVFALRSARLTGSWPAGTIDPSLDGVLRADGFYNLGYPLLLWLARPLAHDNPFLAGRLVAALSGALLLVAGWWLARRLLGRGPALLALLALALSPLVVRYGLYLGTDMPFAAGCVVALALLVEACGARPPAPHQSGMGRATLPAVVLPILAGLAAGFAFLLRHPGLLLLPFGWLAIVAARARSRETGVHEAQRSTFRSLGLFTGAFLLAVAPQLVVNVRDTGEVLFSEQAKNVWLAVFGDGDWGRWAETANDVGLLQVVAQDPARFVASWWANVRGFFGTGAEDTSEFGRALQLRLLAFPANWLAVAGLLGWAIEAGRRQIAEGKRQESAGNPGEAAGFLFPFSLFLLLIVVYVVAISVGLSLQRFFLPLAPIYALAGAWAVTRLASLRRGPHPQLAAGILLTLFLWGGFATGSAYVLRERPPGDAAPGQPAPTAAAARLVQSNLAHGATLAVRLAPGDEDGLALSKYSAISHIVVADDGDYLLWSTALGHPPGGEVVGQAGGYVLLRLN